MLPDKFEIKLHGRAGGRIHLLRAVAAPQFPATLCSHGAFFLTFYQCAIKALDSILAQRPGGLGAPQRKKTHAGRQKQRVRLTVWAWPEEKQGKPNDRMDPL